MAVAGTGQLSYGQFEAALPAFCSWWQQGRQEGEPAWAVTAVRLPVTEEVVTFAQLERVVALPRAQQQPQAGPSTVAAAAAASAVPVAGSGDLAAIAAAEAADEAATPPAAAAAAAAARRHHVHCYSIAHHATYRVPVLLLRAMQPDGALLSLPELLADLPELAASQDAGEQAWTFLSAAEHPATRTPCFMLHPCQTAARMQLLLQTAAGAQNGPGAEEVAAAARGDEAQALLYLQAWASTVAPLLGLRVGLL